MPTCPVLPMEIWAHIVKPIGRPKNPSTYRLHPKRTATLYRLCLASHTLKQLAEPLLYSRAFITPETLPSFCRTITIPHMNSAGAEIFRPSARGRLVTCLALSQFGPESRAINYRIGEVLEALRFVLRRLYLDASLHDVPKHDLLSLERIEEFCFMAVPSLFDSRESSLPAWRTLKRLAVMKIRLDQKLLESLGANLEVCVVAWSRGLDGPTLSSLARGDWTQRPQEFVYVGRPSETDINDLREEMKRVEEQPRGEGCCGVLRLAEVSIHNQVGVGFMQEEWIWFMRSVVDGSIWDVGKDGKVLEPPTSNTVF
ncbi:hypothetical protein FRB95_010527 [Tulasnella sp. JGI-2019a]|nr:hypothetical protein FRB95_010527 [Tulasnella sp. JGI-2019a]